MICAFSPSSSSSALSSSPSSNSSEAAAAAAAALLSAARSLIRLDCSGAADLLVSLLARTPAASRLQREEEDTTDRLSHLPEPILHHILSFMDTISAVQTSVLSRSWNRVWKHVPVLDLCRLSFYEYSSFLLFVSKVLDLRYDLSLRKVSYMDNYRHRHERVDGDDGRDALITEFRDVGMCMEVIQYALSHDTQHLVINLDNEYKDVHQSDRFTGLFGEIVNCNLKTLELKYVCIDDGLRSRGFRMLTTLRLHLCSLASDQYEDFFSNFPSLRNLVLTVCQPWDHGNSIQDGRGLKISGPQLIYLKLDFMVCYKMEISAPKLKFFSLVHNLESLVSIKLSLPSLHHAAIGVQDWDYFMLDNKECGAQRFMSLFQGLNNATYLSLEYFTLRALRKVSEVLEQQKSSPFTRLKSLIVKTFLGRDEVPDELVHYFLKGSSSMNPEVECIRPCHEFVQVVLNSAVVASQMGKKNRKRRRGEEVEEDSTNDRLSSLPEPILYHILSFLDTKSAVQTSVLSRSWNRAWKHVDVLNLSSLSFRRYKRFRRFVFKVLSLRYKLNLRKVSYMDNDDTDVSICVKVIKYALSHAAQHLVINLHNEYKDVSARFTDLFGTVLNCNLNTLELRYVCIDDGLGSCGFGMLTTLSLKYCSLAADQHNDFFSNFPSLKNLVLTSCEPLDDDPISDVVLKISGRQLVSLKLDHMIWLNVEVFSPRLKFFSLRHYLGALQSTKLSLPSLDHVAISVGDCVDFGDDWHLKDNRECGAQRFISLFQGLTNATSLMLDNATIQALSQISEFLEQQPSPFARLKSLIVKAEVGHVPHKLVDYFLKGSSSMKPNLEYV
ncbi:unnamed protein product [Linum tenue]|uniref:F-box domain-containing protein n=1 Tax=Linum tenue TaxID=586396 RepID=A0AAV0NNE3_9ROSI|nr:unnamed protein product [Linum tenue]